MKLPGDIGTALALQQAKGHEGEPINPGAEEQDFRDRRRLCGEVGADPVSEKYRRGELRQQTGDVEGRSGAV